MEIREVSERLHIYAYSKVCIKICALLLRVGGGKEDVRVKEKERIRYVSSLRISEENRNAGYQLRTHMPALLTKSIPPELSTSGAAMRYPAIIHAAPTKNLAGCCCVTADRHVGIGTHEPDKLLTQKRAWKARGRLAGGIIVPLQVLFRECLWSGVGV